MACSRIIRIPVDGRVAGLLVPARSNRRFQSANDHETAVASISTPLSRRSIETCVLNEHNEHNRDLAYTEPDSDPQQDP
jgi:hypothetical protein